MHSHIQIKHKKVNDVERQKNFFCILLLFVFLIGAWAASWWFSFSSMYHPSLILNPFQDPSDFQFGGATGFCIFLHALIVVCMVAAPFLVKLVETTLM